MTVRAVLVFLRRPYGRRRNCLLKPEAADGEDIPVRNEDSGQVHYRLGQKWMQMIVVYDFTALNNAEIGTDLRRSPFPSLGYTN